MKEYGTIRLVTNFEYFHNASLPYEYGTLTRLTPWPDTSTVLYRRCHAVSLLLVLLLH